MLVIAFMFALSAPPRVGRAQSHYTFTRIADTVTSPDANLGGVSCVALSDSGTVVIYSNQVWRGDGSAGLASVAVSSPICPSINDLDEITHYVTDGPTNLTTLVRNTNGALTILASNHTSPYLSRGTTYLASLSHSGSAVYLANGEPPTGAGAGIYIGPGAVKVISNTTEPQITQYVTASMNDDLVVAFRAFNTLSSKFGIYRGSATPLFEDGGPVITNVSANRPVINNSGTVAFVGRDASARIGVFKTDDGVNFTFVGAGATQSGHDRISINNHGVVAFDAAAAAGVDETIFVGPGPASPVISRGDELDGSTVQLLLMWEEALNDSGQVAFWAHLADGRSGVYRADPNRPPTASDGTASVEAGAAVSGNLSATDPDADPLAFTIVTNGTKGTAVITDASTGGYTYNADVGSSGTDTFTFVANDGFADSNTATITIMIPGSCASDISATVAISGQGPAKFNKKTGRYAQSLTLKNGDGAISGPISMVLDNIGGNATLFNAAGVTACAVPSGSPFVNVNVGSDSVFSPRERATVTLEFTSPSGQALTYTTRVLAGSGDR